MGNTGVDDTEIRLLVRSLRDHEQVKSQEPGMRKWLRVHDESERSLITSLLCENIPSLGSDEFMADGLDWHL